MDSHFHGNDTSEAKLKGAGIKDGGKDKEFLLILIK